MADERKTHNFQYIILIISIRLRWSCQSAGGLPTYCIQLCWKTPAAGVGIAFPIILLYCGCSEYCWFECC